jgi:STAG domain
MSEVLSNELDNEKYVLSSNNSKVRDVYFPMLTSFWTSFVERCPLELLIGVSNEAPSSASSSDENSGVLNTLLEYLLPITSMHSRPLRHVSTVITMSIANGLLVKAETSRKSAITADKQLAADQKILAALEQKRGAGSKAEVSAASASIQDYKARILAATNLVKLNELCAARLSEGVDLVYKNVFMHRYRDTSGDVRQDTLHIYVSWLTTSPQTFIANQYLKFLGWMLNDGESSNVREEALKGLASIYSHSPDFVEGVAEFAARFRGRIAEMIDDIDDDVAAAAVATLEQMLAYGHLTSDEVGRVHVNGLCSDALVVRKRAGQFLVKQLPQFADADASMEADDSNKKSKSAAADSGKLRRSRQQLYALLRLIDANLDEDAKGDAGVTGAVVEHVVSAFWGLPSASVLLDFDCMVELIMHGDKMLVDEGEDSQAVAGGAVDPATGELSAWFQRLALRLMVVCVQRTEHVSSEGADEPAQKNPPKHAFDAAAVAAAKDAAAASIVPKVADLLRRFQDDVPSIVVLSSLLASLSLSSFGPQRMHKPFESLLYVLGTLIRKHSNPLVLEELARSYRVLCESEHTMARVAQIQAASLLSGLTTKANLLVATITSSSAKDAAEATSTKSGSKKGKAKAKSSSDAYDDPDDASSNVPSSFSAASRALVATLRRIAAFAQCFDNVAEVAPELARGSDFFLSLRKVLTFQRQLSTLFELSAHVKSSAHAEDEEDPAQGLHYAISVEGLRILQHVTMSSLLQASTLASSITTSSSSDQLEAIQPVLDKYLQEREELIEHAFECISLCHPAQPDSYDLPPSVSSLEATYVWRLRMSGYEAICATLISVPSSVLLGTAMKQALWDPSEPQVAAIGRFIKTVMGSSKKQLKQLGIDFKSVGADDEDEDDNDDLMDGSSQEKQKQLLNAYAFNILTPFARAVQSRPYNASLFSLFLSLVLEDSRGTSASDPVTAILSKAFREVRKDSMWGTKLESLGTALGPSTLMVAAHDLIQAQAEAISGSLAAKNADALIQSCFQTVNRLARTLYGSALKSVPSELLLPTVHMLQRGIRSGFRDVPASLPMFSMLSHFVSTISTLPGAYAHLLKFFDQEVRQLVTRENYQGFHAAMTAYYERRLQVSEDSELALDEDGTVLGYRPEELKPWLCAYDFRVSLRLGESGASLKNAVPNALYTLQVVAGVSTGSSAPPRAPAVPDVDASEPRRPKKKPAAKAKADDMDLDEDVELEEEGAKPPARTSRLPRRGSKQGVSYKEAADEDDEDEDEEDADEQYDGHKRALEVRMKAAKIASGSKKTAAASSLETSVLSQGTELLSQSQVPSRSLRKAIDDDE